MHRDVNYLIADPKHYSDISEIFNENILQRTVTLWDRTFSVADIEKLISCLSEREKLYVLQLGDQVIGWGMIKRYHEKEGYAKTCETSVFLRKNFINQGYGTPFKRFILDRCRDFGYHHVHAKIIASNKISIAYNQKLGYSIVGIQKEIGFVNGQWIDVVIMQLLI